jgi:hypothetical protein
MGLEPTTFCMASGSWDRLTQAEKARSATTSRPRRRLAERPRSSCRTSSQTCGAGSGASRRTPSRKARRRSRRSTSSPRSGSRRVNSKDSPTKRSSIYGGRSSITLPHFADFRLSAITPQEIDRYKVAKVRDREAIEAARAKGEKIRDRGLSNNSINHTLSDLARVLETCGDDLRYTASQLGHEDGRFTIRCYAQAARRRERLAGRHLQAYDRAVEWARIGAIAPTETPGETALLPEPLEARAH